MCGRATSLSDDIMGMHSRCVVGVVVTLVTPEKDGKAPDEEPEGKGVDEILA